MSTLEKQKLEYETKLLKELLTAQYQLSGKVDDELFEQFKNNIQKLYK